MAVVQVDSSRQNSNIYTHVFLPVVLALGVMAQIAIDAGHVLWGVTGYLAAMACVLAGVVFGAPARARTRDRDIAPTGTTAAHEPLALRLLLAVIALAAGAGTFALSSDNRYRLAGVVLWLASMVCWWLAWAGGKGKEPGLGSQNSEARTQMHPPARRSSLIAMLVLVAILALGAAFRFADLYNNPRDMNSDQAEKLLDVRDVLNGTPYIFFERNTGREPWQFYWTVALIKLFNLRPDFMALKVGTALIGWLMLPAVFLLAREIFGTRTALIATLFAAVASWGVITARFGLRYPLAPCATAWTLYFLVRALKRNERTSMLAAGVWLGIGLQGYTAYRFMAVVVVLIGLLWVGWSLGQRRHDLARDTLVHGLLAIVMAVLVLMPLIRYGVEHPDMFLYRAATRLSDAEKPIPGESLSIFTDNVKNVLLMFNYTHDEVWVANLPDRPAMDAMLGALLVLGATGATALSMRQRSPWPIIVLGAGVLMLIPSALSLAFPRENPSVVRTGGALPMLMIVCAITPGMLLSRGNYKNDGGQQKRGGQHTFIFHLPLPTTAQFVSWSTVSALCAMVIALNIQRVFVDYPAQYCPRAQNASDIAREMDAWVAAGNPRENAWIVGYPHWVDTRAVGVWIGDITFPNTVGTAVGLPDAASVDLHGQPGWFALNELDASSLQSLKLAYPNGQARQVTGSLCSEKRFIVFTTP